MVNERLHDMTPNEKSLDLKVSAKKKEKKRKINQYLNLLRLCQITFHSLTVQYNRIQELHISFFYLIQSPEVNITTSQISYNHTYILPI